MGTIYTSTTFFFFKTTILKKLHHQSGKGQCYYDNHACIFWQQWWSMLGTCCSIHSAYIQFVVSERLVGSEETSRLTNLQTSVTHKLQDRPINNHHFMTQSGATMHSKPCMVRSFPLGIGHALVIISGAGFSHAWNEVT